MLSFTDEQYVLKDYERNVDISGNIDNDDACINDITCDGDELSHKLSMVLTLEDTGKTT